MKEQEVLTVDAYRRLLAQQEEMEAKEKKGRGHPEHDVQVACVAWFRAVYPNDAPMLFAVPNGGHRNKAEAARMKAEGVTPGVSDLILLEARGRYGALCIEMKTHARGSGQSEWQEWWQGETEKAGNRYVVVRDVDEFAAAVREYMALPRRKD